MREVMLTIVGVILMLWGIADFVLSWVGTDLYWEIGINLPDWLYPMTGFIAMGIGGFLLFMETYKKTQKGMVAEFEGSLDEGETLLKSSSAGIRESLNKQEGGVLLLTNRRLFYRGSNKVIKGKISYEDVGSNDFELLLGDISSVEITKFPSYIIIKDKDNNELSPNKFSIGMREKKEWKNEILKAVSGTD